jgi:hypothetical protein
MHRRLSLRDRAAALTAAALVACVGFGWAPATGASQAAPLREIGAGSLHWFGLHVYDARLAVAGERFDPAQPFALTLRYARDLSGNRIAEASIDEIRRLGFGTPADHRRWLDEMRGVFPDVRRGDELTGASTPGRGVRFLLNGRPIGSVDEPEFARAFFAIWFDPRTHARDLRASLLGGPR